MLVVTILWRIGDPAGVRMGRWVLADLNKARHRSDDQDARNHN